MTSLRLGVVSSNGTVSEENRRSFSNDCHFFEVPGAKRVLLGALDDEKLIRIESEMTESIHIKNWISTLDVDSDFRPTDENQYQSENYASAKGNLNIRFDSRLGNIKIRRTK